ncbi:MAG: DUF1624 domain-containing protein [Atopobiaceae bacterium]|nr:DUF1624 domain-containing protein [Atopobiaceae bacterium]
MGDRFHLFDALRGFSILSMVAFHFCYDLKFIAGYSMDWFAPPLQDVWRASISWTFLLIAGIMCSLSKDNLKRSLRYGALALAIYVVTLVAAVDYPISFGIIYCMAACTFVSWLLSILGIRPKGPIAGAILLVCFLLLLGVPYGYVGAGAYAMRLPTQWYASPWLSWLGLPGPGFISGDYYPLIPYLLLFLAGSAFGWWWKDIGFPEACSKIKCAPLEFVGRHPLEIYIVHQPVLLGICALIARNV